MVSPFRLREPVTVFCPGPSCAPFKKFTRELYRKLGSSVEIPFYLAYSPDDLQYGDPAPGSSTLCSPRTPEVVERALASAHAVLSFRIEPLLIAIKYGIPSFFIAVDETGVQMAEKARLPYFRLLSRTSVTDVWDWFQRELAGAVRPAATVETVATERRFPDFVGAAIADWQYLPLLIGLVENLREVHGENFKLHVLALDEASWSFLKSVDFILNCVVYDVSDLWDIDERARLSERGMARQAYTAKARLLLHVLTRTRRPVTFLDVDLYLWRSPVQLEAKMDRSAVLLFPHWNRVFANNRAHGVFNSGLLVVRPGGEKFLSWWDRLCVDACENNPTQGLYFEQGYLDAAPALFSEVGIYRRGDHNVGPWSLESVDIPFASYHAAGADPRGNFEFKSALDQVVARFAGIDRGLGPSSFTDLIYQQQRRYWPEVDRVVYGYEKGIGLGRFLDWRLTTRAVEFGVRGWGRHALSLLARIRSGRRRNLTSDPVEATAWAQGLRERLTPEAASLVPAPDLLSPAYQIEKLKRRGAETPSGGSSERTAEGEKTSPDSSLRL